MLAPRIALALGLAIALVVPAAAQAAPVNDSYAINVASQSYDLGSYRVRDAHNWELTYVDYDLDVTSRATWTGSLSTVTSWNSTNVRQGATLPVSRVSPVQSGSLRVSWTVRGEVLSNAIARDINKTITVDAPCTPSLLGSTYDCTASSYSLSLLRMAVPNAPYVNLKLTAKFKITPEGAIVTRSLTTAGFDPVTESGLGLSPAPVIDNVEVPCAQAGSPVAYKLGAFHWTPAVAVTQQPRIEKGVMDAVLGQIELPAMYDQPYGAPIKTNPAFDLTASGHTSALGTVAPNNVAPVIAPGSYNRWAGEPTPMTANVSARCDIASYVWKFSDGTTAYGPSPVKTFSKPGTVTGQLKVTDTSGLSATRDFTVIVTG